MLPHIRPRYFTDVNIAARIDGDAVRRDELPRLLAGVNVTEARQPLAGLVVDIDPVAEVRRGLVDAQTRPQLADITDRSLFRRVHVERARPVQVIPLRFVIAVAARSAQRR